jgi:hypothetical protein
MLQGLRMSLTKSAGEVKGSLSIWMGQGVECQMVCGNGHFVKRWRMVSSWALQCTHILSMDCIRMARVDDVGRIFQAIFQSMSLWRALSFAFHREFHSE